MTKKRAVLELLVADFFWGFAFVAVPLAQKSWDSSQIAFIRFALPSLMGLLIGLMYKKWQINGRDLFLGLSPGFFFAATIYTQTMGLEFTTSSKSSFITVLYVLFVPLLEMILYKKRPAFYFWASVFGALIGMGFLFNLSLDNWNKGDTLTLACALFSTWHIHQVGTLARKSRHPLFFNLAQCFWATIFLFPIAMTSSREWWPTTLNWSALFGLAMITFGATVIAFSIQARVQMHLDLSTSSIIFLIESPIAMFFSWWILTEPISIAQCMGAVIILFSCYMAIRASPECKA